MSPLPSLPPPLKSMCSTQWVEPVMPGTSLREPMRYTTHVERAFVSGIGRRMTFRPLSSVSTRVGIRPVGRRAGDIKLPETHPVARTRAGAKRPNPELVVPLPARRHPSRVLLFHLLVKGLAVGDYFRREPSEPSPDSPLMGPLPVPDKLHQNPYLFSLDSEIRPDRKQKGLHSAPVPDQLVSSLPSSISRNLVGEDPTEITLQLFQDGPVGVVNAYPRHVLEIPSFDDPHFRENQTALSISEACKILCRHFPRNVPERPTAVGASAGRSPSIETLETSVERFSNLPLPRGQGRQPPKLASSRPNSRQLIRDASQLAS